MSWFRCRSRYHGDLWKCGVDGTVVKLFQQDWGLQGLRWCNRELHLGGHQNSLVVRLPLLLLCSFFLSLYSYTTRNPNWADHIPSKTSLMPPFWTPAKVFSFRLPKNQTLRDSSWQVQQQREIAWLGLLHMLKSSQTNDEQQSEQRETALPRIPSHAQLLKDKWWTTSICFNPDKPNLPRMTYQVQGDSSIHSKAAPDKFKRASSENTNKK